MQSKRYTVLVIPEGARQVRRFSLQSHLLRSLAVAALVVLVGVGALSFDYWRLHFDRSELVDLRAENRDQRIVLADLGARLDSLQDDVAQLTQNDTMLRALAKIDPPGEEVLGGVGGPETMSEPAEISALQKQIDRVRRQIDLRRQSQQEIEGFLNDQHSLLAAKPDGWPVKGWLTSLFGRRKDPFTGRRKMHEGLDIASRTGTPVHATADGVVSRVGMTPGYGKLVVVDHGYGYQTYYGHNSKLRVKLGQRVKRGDLLAAVGSTGSSTGPHVHYEVRRNGVPVNPRKFL